MANGWCYVIVPAFPFSFLSTHHPEPRLYSTVFQLSGCGFGTPGSSTFPLVSHKNLGCLARGTLQASKPLVSSAEWGSSSAAFVRYGHSSTSGAHVGKNKNRPSRM